VEVGGEGRANNFNLWALPTVLAQNFPLFPFPQTVKPPHTPPPPHPHPHPNPLKVVTNEKGEAVGEVVTIIC
jgi:hypothetical protein